MAISVHVLGQPVGARHRLGAPGLKYCRHLRPVRARLVTWPERLFLPRS
jgi:hypothetical protein